MATSNQKSFWSSFAATSWRLLKLAGKSALIFLSVQNPGKAGAAAIANKSRQSGENKDISYSDVSGALNHASAFPQDLSGIPSSDTARHQADDDRYPEAWRNGNIRRLFAADKYIQIKSEDKAKLKINPEIHKYLEEGYLIILHSEAKIGNLKTLTGVEKSYINPKSYVDTNGIRYHNPYSGRLCTFIQDNRLEIYNLTLDQSGTMGAKKIQTYIDQKPFDVERLLEGIYIEGFDNLKVAKINLIRPKDASFVQMEPYIQRKPEESPSVFYRLARSLNELKRMNPHIEKLLSKINAARQKIRKDQTRPENEREKLVLFLENLLENLGKANQANILQDNMKNLKNIADDFDATFTKMTGQTDIPANLGGFKAQIYERVEAIKEQLENPFSNVEVSSEKKSM